MVGAGRPRVDAAWHSADQTAKHTITAGGYNLVLDPAWKTGGALGDREITGAVPGEAYERVFRVDNEVPTGETGLPISVTLQPHATVDVDPLPAYNVLLLGADDRSAALRATFWVCDVAYTETSGPKSGEYHHTCPGTETKVRDTSTFPVEGFTIASDIAPLEPGESLWVRARFELPDKTPPRPDAFYGEELTLDYSAGSANVGGRALWVAP